MQRTDVRFYISVASFVAYAIAFFLLFDIAGNNVGALTFLPVIVSGWMFGLRGGLLGAAAVIVLNWLLFPPSTSVAALLVPGFATFAMGAFVGWVQDLRSKIQRQHEELAKVARRDQLTGLLNRATFKLGLERVLERPGMHAVMYLDLDGFKDVNDTYGHAVGDLLLGEVASRLVEAVRDEDLVARIGGDEFVIALPYLTSMDQVIEPANRILASLGRPARIEGSAMRVTASLGIAVSPHDAKDAEGLLHAADQAMYEAKRRGKNNYSFPSVNPDDLGDTVTAFTVQRAMQKSEFSLAFQPQRETGSSQLVGLEALLRWQHPDRGVLDASVFVPVAESSGLIVPLGNWALREACRKASSWRRDGWPDVRVAVNVSAGQLLHAGFVSEVAAVLEETGLPANGLELEIGSRSFAVRSSEALAAVESLRGLGVRLALDNIGKDDSVLGVLHRLRVDTVKLDRTLLSEAVGTSEDARRMRLMLVGIGHLAHELGMQTLAEGVESGEHDAAARSVGSDLAQGTWIASPIPGETLRKWLREREAQRREQVLA